MKKLFLSFVLLLTTAFIYAQTPNAFNYQAVARNASGTALVSTTIAVLFTIHDGSAGGTSLYSERDTVTTNQFGLFAVKIGTGTVVSGTFDTITWSNTTKYLDVQFDPTGGYSYTDMGATQLLSVPFAKVADVALNSPWAANGTAIYNTNPGFVGIGTTNPASPLHVISSSYNDVATFDGANGMYITLSELGTPKGYIGSYSGAADDVDFGTYGSNTDGGINFTIQDVPQMTIAYSGRVGIGTESPTGQLSVVNDGSGLSAPSIYTSNTNTAGIGIWVNTNSSDATAVFTNATGSDANGDNAATMAKFFDGGASDLVRIDNYGEGFHDGRISLWGQNTGNTGGGYAYGFANGIMLGDIISGTYHDVATAYNPTGSEQVFSPAADDEISLGTSNIRWTAVYAVNGTIQTSDERLKENVQPISYGLNELMSLTPVSYQWKNPKARLGSGNNLGFLAQDLQKVLPDVVIHSQASQEEIGNAKNHLGVDIANTDTYGVKYSEIIPVLVKAIQEQQAEIEALKLQVNNQEKK